MRQGFTLIELIVVICILALLSMVTVPMIITVLNNSKNKMFITNVKELVSVAQQDMAENLRTCSETDGTSKNTEEDQVKYCVYEVTYEGNKNVIKIKDENINFSGVIEKGEGSIKIDEDGQTNKVKIWSGSLTKCAVLQDDDIIIDNNIKKKSDCLKG